MYAAYQALLKSYDIRAKLKWLNEGRGFGERFSVVLSLGAVKLSTLFKKSK